jgi:hypothetical protein
MKRLRFESAVMALFTFIMYLALAPPAFGVHVLVDDYREVLTRGGYGPSNTLPPFTDAWLNVESSSRTSSDDPRLFSASVEDPDIGFTDAEANQSSSIPIDYPGPMWAEGSVYAAAAVPGPGAGSGAAIAEANAQSNYDVWFDLLHPHDYSFSFTRSEREACGGVATVFSYLSRDAADTDFVFQFWREGGSSTGVLAPGSYHLRVHSLASADALNGESRSAEGDFHMTFSLSRSVPEPTAMLLIGSGIIGLAAFRRKFRK